MTITLISSDLDNDFNNGVGGFVKFDIDAYLPIDDKMAGFEQEGYESMKTMKDVLVNIPGGTTTLLPTKDNWPANYYETTDFRFIVNDSSIWLINNNSLKDNTWHMDKKFRIHNIFIMEIISGFNADENNEVIKFNLLITDVVDPENEYYLRTRLQIVKGGKSNLTEKSTWRFDKNKTYLFFTIYNLIDKEKQKPDRFSIACYNKDISLKENGYKKLNTILSSIERNNKIKKGKTIKKGNIIQTTLTKSIIFGLLIENKTLKRLIDPGDNRAIFSFSQLNIINCTPPLDTKNQIYVTDLYSENKLKSLNNEYANDKRSIIGGSRFKLKGQDNWRDFFPLLKGVTLPPSWGKDDDGNERAGSGIITTAWNEYDYKNKSRSINTSRDKGCNIDKHLYTEDYEIRRASSNFDIGWFYSRLQNSLSLLLPAP